MTLRNFSAAQLPTARVLAAGAATASVIALAACSSPQSPTPGQSSAPSQPPATVTVTPTPEPSSPAPSSPAPSASPTPTPTPTPDTDTNAAMLAAGSTARKAVDGSTVVSIESERGGWEVQLVLDDGAEREVRTNAAGSDITSGPTNTRPDAEDRAENRQVLRADVSYREAARIVLREVSGGQLRELNLDSDNGRLTWEADVRVGNQKRSVELDADSGRVLTNQLDD